MYTLPVGRKEESKGTPLEQNVTYVLVSPLGLNTQATKFASTTKTSPIIMLHLYYCN